MPVIYVCDAVTGKIEEYIDIPDKGGLPALRKAINATLKALNDGGLKICGTAYDFIAFAPDRKKPHGDIRANFFVDFVRISDGFPDLCPDTAALFKRLKGKN